VEKSRRLGVGDWTGHGVAGAFMSMLGNSLSNEIVKREGVTKADQSLNLLRVHLNNALQQEAVGNDVRDGMDISICALYYENDQNKNGPFTLEYAGAHNPMFIVSHLNNSLGIEGKDNDFELLEKNSEFAIYQLRADLMPISMHFRIEPFSLKTINVHKNDMIYLYTDGIIDQIGGPDYKKISSTRLRKILLDISHENADFQRQTLEKDIVDWMNYPDPITGSPCDQIDDICVLGIRVS